MDLQVEVKKLRKYMENNMEVFLESEVADLKKKLKKSLQYFIELTGLYNEQQNVIKKLKKKTIETIGKVMISYLLTQSDQKSQSDNPSNIDDDIHVNVKKIDL